MNDDIGYSRSYNNNNNSLHNHVADAANFREIAKCREE